jgi:CRP/FNR family cyclic AMP-dependent transcriptional regulator
MSKFRHFDGRLGPDSGEVDGGMEWVLLGALDDEDRRGVLASCRRQRFRKGEAVFREGDPGHSLHLLASGTAAVQVSTPLGDVATIDVLRPGDAFGEQALVADDTLRSATVVALEPAETLRLTRGDFERLMAEHPKVATLLLRVFDQRLRTTSQDLLDALYLPAETRIFRRLARLAEIYAARPSIPLTQDEVASMAGTTRQTLNKVLHQAQQEGLVALARGRIEVTNPSALARRARLAS